MPRWPPLRRCAAVAEQPACPALSGGRQGLAGRAPAGGPLSRATAVHVQCRCALAVLGLGLPLCSAPGCPSPAPAGAGVQAGRRAAGARGRGRRHQEAAPLHGGAGHAGGCRVGHPPGRGGGPAGWHSTCHARTGRCRGRRRAAGDARAANRQLGTPLLSLIQDVPPRAQPPRRPSSHRAVWHPVQVWRRPSGAAVAHQARWAGLTHSAAQRRASVAGGAPPGSRARPAGGTLSPLGIRAHPTARQVRRHAGGRRGQPRQKARPASRCRPCSSPPTSNDNTYPTLSSRLCLPPTIILMPMRQSFLSRLPEGCAAAAEARMYSPPLPPLAPPDFLPPPLPPPAGPPVLASHFIPALPPSLVARPPPRKPRLFLH